MVNLSNIKHAVLKHNRILYRMPPHFVTIELSLKHLGNYYESPEIKQLVKLALDRLDGRICVDLRPDINTLIIGFESAMERDFFLLMLPNQWFRK